jgi:hypothetical protein
MSSLDWVGLIGVSLRFVEEPPGYTLLRPFLLLWSLAMARPCNVLDRLLPLSVATVEFQVCWPVQSMSILAWVGLIGVSLRVVKEPPRFNLAATVSFAFFPCCYCSFLQRSGSIVAALCFYS